ncbi:MAG: aminotransferase class I/II-fold pyridoxal phosphate-dependent enzyme [Ktedonobacterales bacterium]|nr:aminotransferase class I/II-fold pyridoxal phosphate-dependent enzyme [Ktedonobacterales bacterium]
MNRGAPYTRLIADLPATVPFLAPEAIERRDGRPLVLRLGANESAFGPSPRACEAMGVAAARAAYYGDPESYELRAALASHHGVRMEQLVVGSGIDDLLGLIVRTFLDRGEVAVTSLGAYPTFNYHVAGYGGTLERVPYHENANDLEALAAAARRTHARLVYLANPDNPTGAWHTTEDLGAFIERLPEHCLLVLDEAYSDFAPPEALPPMVGEDDPRVIRLRTFSKAHGLAGARIGYAVATAETIATFEKIRLHFGVNLLAQAGALASLADTDYLRGVVVAVAEGRRAYEALARDLGLTPLPSATNFVAIDVGGSAQARALMEALAARAVFIRMPGVPPLDRCIRVTVGTPAERALFATILREVWPR